MSWKKFLFAGLLLATAFAVPQGAEVQYAGINETYTTNPETETIAAGYVKSVNLTAYPATALWAGFFGNVSGYIVLADSAKNEMFHWVPTSYTGSIVWADEDNTVDWLNLTAGDCSLLGSPWTDTRTDSCANTYTNTGDLVSPTLGTISSVPYVLLYDNTGAGTYKSYLVKDDTNGDALYAAEVIDNGNGFNGYPTDYELLVPENGIGNADTTMFYFWLEFA